MILTKSKRKQHTFMILYQMAQVWFKSTNYWKHTIKEIETFFFLLYLKSGSSFVVMTNFIMTVGQSQGKCAEVWRQHTLSQIFGLIHHLLYLWSLLLSLFACLSIFMVVGPLCPWTSLSLIHQYHMIYNFCGVFLYFVVLQTGTEMDVTGIILDHESTLNSSCLSGVETS